MRFEKFVQFVGDFLLTGRNALVIIENPLLIVRGTVGTRWAVSSAGRAPRSQCGGRGFDPPTVHHSFLNGRLAQLVEHCDHTAGVTGSSPVAPTTQIASKPFQFW